MRKCLHIHTSTTSPFKIQLHFTKMLSLANQAKSFFHCYHNQPRLEHSCWPSLSQLYFNGKMVGWVKLSTGNESVAMPGSNDVAAHRFVLGQELDTIDGDFQATQLLRSKLSEFQMWNVTLNQSMIQEMATCQSFPIGNVVSWNQFRPVQCSLFKGKSSFLSKHVQLDSDSRCVQFCYARAGHLPYF